MTVLKNDAVGCISGKKKVLMALSTRNMGNVNVEATDDGEITLP